MREYFKKFIIQTLSIFIGIVFAISPYAFAIAQTATSTDDDSLIFAISINPRVPSAGETVTASIQTPTFSLSSAEIQWFVNSAVQHVASSSRTISFRAPLTEGSAITVKAVITVNGQKVEQSIDTQTRFTDDTAAIQENLQKQIQELESQYGPSSQSLFEQVTGSAEPNPANSFSIVSDNTNPGPAQKVNLTVQSFSFDPDQSFIQWFEDGKKVLEGTGEKTYLMETGDLGSQKIIKARVTLPLGQIVESSITVTPFSLSLYWWANTSVPYWYKGKALPTTDNLVYVSAFPPVTIQKQKTFIYQWTLNNDTKTTASGVGKQTFSFRPRLKGLADSIEINVSDAKKTLSFNIPMQIPNINPEVHFCVIDIISGCTRGANIASVQGGDSIDIKANPFYFGKDEVRFLNYLWNINGENSSKKGTTRPFVATIKTPKETRGIFQANVSLESIVSQLTSQNVMSIEVK